MHAVRASSLWHRSSLEGRSLSLQGMAFSVAMNSKRSNAIVALLIASNFAEIKGVVLKRFDPRRLLVLSFQVRTLLLGFGTWHVFCHSRQDQGRGAQAPLPAAATGPVLPGVCPVRSWHPYMMSDPLHPLPSSRCLSLKGMWLDSTAPGRHACRSQVLPHKAACQASTVTLIVWLQDIVGRFHHLVVALAFVLVEETWQSSVRQLIREPKQNTASCVSVQDIVERFHLVVALAFVLVEEMANNGRARPDAALLRTCAYFFSFEIVIGGVLWPSGSGFWLHSRLCS